MSKRQLIFIPALLLAACTTQPPPTPQSFDVLSYEQSCARAVETGYRSAEECRQLIGTLRWSGRVSTPLHSSPVPSAYQPISPALTAPYRQEYRERAPIQRQGGTLIVGDGHGSFLVIP